ncbi:uncharacterized protein LOC105699062 [Orussus abietinus]|uniref:uncharacterized protein LOC105699062 n=1 Tax=Orussus abietinus TaxID=222816 RepID=UPI00062639C0|nr:uncharacterized protein LOC105699062 [Orussus abietinus]
MGFSSISADFGLLFLLLAVLLYARGAQTAELCPAENCIPEEQCEEPVFSTTCAGQQETCCSVVKSAFRTKCRHHGGICMERCGESLRRIVTDCPANEVCCVLV